MLAADQQAAVSAFPPLRRLLQERPCPTWRFRPERQGELTLLSGWRVWLLGGWNEGFAIAGLSDACAFRCDFEGGVVWRRDGTLADVVDGLVDLPEPNNRAAPRLVKGGPSEFWVPGAGL